MCFLFGQRHRRGRWPMLSHIWGIFSFFFSLYFVDQLIMRLIFGQRPQRGHWPMLSHIWGIFSFFFSSSFAQILASRPKSQPKGTDPSLEAQISALKSKSQPRGRMPGGGGEEEGENSPYVWKYRSSTPSESLPCSPLNFKHNLLRQGTGTADHLTLLRLFLTIQYPVCLKKIHSFPSMPSFLFLFLRISIWFVRDFAFGPKELHSIHHWVSWSKNRPASCWLCPLPSS